MTNRDIFDLVSDIGVEMLKNGGEIPRTIMTMEQIGRSFGIRDYDVYILANGIFASGVMGEDKPYFCKIRNVSISPTYLCRVEAINELSRNIVAGQVNPEEARERLNKIKVMEEYSFPAITFAMGIGSGSFCYLFKGDFYDCAVAMVVGMLLNLFIHLVSTRLKLPKIMKNILFAMFVSFLCCTARYFGLGTNLGCIIIGSIMPLVPGIPLTNGIRDLCNDDYVSGLIRMVDAVLVGVSIGCGVGVVMLLWNSFIGGVVL